jgi:YnbE-like lipoprotein
VPPEYSHSVVRWGRTSAVVLGLLLAACQPTVRVEAPKDPIVINLNVKIEQEVRIKLEKDVEQLLEQDDAIF